jgi:hypothetical protein
MNRLKHFWPLGIPLALGTLVVFALIGQVRGASTGSDLEGALFLLEFGGIGASIALLLLTIGIIVAIAKQWFVPFPIYAALLFVALLPVTYLQCVSPQTSLMPFFWIPLHIEPPDLNDIGRVIAVNSSLYVASFALVAAGSYAFCRRWI